LSINGAHVQVMHGLESSMMQQLKESVDTKNRFGVGFASAEAWDVMQIKVYITPVCLLLAFR